MLPSYAETKYWNVFESGILCDRISRLTARGMSGATGRTPQGSSNAHSTSSDLHPKPMQWINVLCVGNERVRRYFCLINANRILVSVGILVGHVQRLLSVYPSCKCGYGIFDAANCGKTNSFHENSEVNGKVKMSMTISHVCPITSAHTSPQHLINSGMRPTCFFQCQKKKAENTQVMKARLSVRQLRRRLKGFLNWQV